jgi:hypothetical protein
VAQPHHQQGDSIHSDGGSAAAPCRFLFHVLARALASLLTDTSRTHLLATIGHCLAREEEEGTHWRPSPMFATVPNFCDEPSSGNDSRSPHRTTRPGRAEAVGLREALGRSGAWDAVVSQFSAPTADTVQIAALRVLALAAASVSGTREPRVNPAAQETAPVVCSPRARIGKDRTLCAVEGVDQFLKSDNERVKEYAAQVLNFNFLSTSSRPARRSMNSTTTTSVRVADDVVCVVCVSCVCGCAGCRAQASKCDLVTAQRA